MQSPPDSPPAPALSGLQAVFLAEREKLLRFLKARGADADAEDLLQEVWLKIAAPARGEAPVGAPLAYLFQVANSLMIDRYRSRRQAALRDHNWAASQGGDPAGDAPMPTPERIAIGRDLLQHVTQALEQAGPRAAAIFRRHRVDGVPQREIAREFALSLSTVESDLRVAYRIIARLKEQSDEA